VTEDEKQLRDIYFAKYPEASEEDCVNWILDVYAEDDKLMAEPIICTGQFHSLRGYLEELEERLV